jgi:hypothetical protein
MAGGKPKVSLAPAALLALLGAARAADPGDARVESRSVFGYDPKPDFIAFDPDYAVKHSKAHEALRELQLELARQAAAGRSTPASRQVFLEARWLVYYSAHWDRIDRRLAELRRLLALPADPPDAREQVEADGSYDHASEAWFLKLDSTVEEIEDRASRGEEGPKHPLRLLDRINSPDQLAAYLDGLLISDVRRTGIDQRFELNIAITSIERLLVGDLGDVDPFQPGLRQALFDYQDRKWQDPKTGYFGAWYHTPDGAIRKTADISITFHIASYRRDSLKHVPEMIRTTIAFKDQEYSFGWLEEGQRSNHHNYDVARLFRIGWPFLDEEERERARAEMRSMIDFCLKETMNPDGSFKLMDEDTLGSSFLFPVSLLNELGYFRPSKRFWTDEEFPAAREVADRVAAKIEALGLTDPESRKALRRIEEARLERWIRWGVEGLLAVGAIAALWLLGRRIVRRGSRAITPPGSGT